MPSIDEFSAAIGDAASSAESVITAIGAAKSNGDELATAIDRAGAEGSAARTRAVGGRLESEAAALALRLKDLLEEIKGQAHGLGDTLSAVSGGGSGLAAFRSVPPPLVPRITGGRRYSGHAQERMVDPTRRVSPSEIETAITRGKSRDGRNPGTTEHYDPETKIHVVTNSDGDVVTVRRQSRTPGWAK